MGGAMLSLCLHYLTQPLSTWCHFMPSAVMEAEPGQSQASRACAVTNPLPGRILSLSPTTLAGEKQPECPCVSVVFMVWEWKVIWDCPCLLFYVWTVLRLVTRVVFVADAEAVTHGNLVWSSSTLRIFICFFFFMRVKELIKLMSLLQSQSADAKDISHQLMAKLIPSNASNRKFSNTLCAISVASTSRLFLFSPKNCFATHLRPALIFMLSLT